jgi:hypothetical protein
MVLIQTAEERVVGGREREKEKYYVYCGDGV